MDCISGVIVCIFQVASVEGCLVLHLICGCVRSGVVCSCSGLSLSARFAWSFSFCSVCSCAHHRGHPELLGVWDSSLTGLPSFDILLRFSCTRHCLLETTSSLNTTVLWLCLDCFGWVHATRFLGDCVDFFGWLLWTAARFCIWYVVVFDLSLFAFAQVFRFLLDLFLCPP